MLTDQEDAYGHAVYDYYNKRGGYEITERDDGYFDVSLGPGLYLSGYDKWPEHERKATEYVRGTVLDIGCGAGRHSLYLQKQGIDVTGVDVSPLAVEVARLRGLKKGKVLSVTEITPELGIFDTIIMFGNNFGLFGSLKRARWLLRRFKTMTSEGARIVAETRDPHQTELPEHIQYHEFNRKRGRMPGQIRLRVRYRKYKTPWFDYLMVSKDEMRKILENTGWVEREFIDGDHGIYIALIEKE